MTFDGTDSWSILTEEEFSLQEKINNSGPTLKEQGISVNFGQKTGLNDAFIISSSTRDLLLSQCKSDDEFKRTEALVKPVLRGRDIKKYYSPLTSSYIILAYNGFYKVAREQYPVLYNHLIKYEQELKDKEYDEMIVRHVKRLEEVENQQKEAKKQQALKEKEIRDKPNFGKTK